MKLRITTIIYFLLFFIAASAADTAERLNRNFEITGLTNNIYLAKSSFSGDGNLNCNHLIIIDSTEIVLVNTPVNDSLTSVILDCIEKRFKKPVKKVIVSHFHDDSAGGLMETARCGIVSYGLNKTDELLKPSGMKIDMVFSDSMDIPLQTKKVKLIYFGGGHSIDNILVWLPEEKILYGGCLLKSLSANNIGNIKDADINSWVNTVKKVQHRCCNAKIIIPGHMEYGDTAIFDHTIEIVSQKN
jgi:metallo-beta-lactamase class B